MRDLSFGTTFAVLSLDRRNDNSRRRTEFLGLILVVGHELAHANLGHLNKRRANAVIGWIGGVAADAGIMLGGMSTYGALSRVLTQAGARAFSVAFEREADYVGAYMPPVVCPDAEGRRGDRRQETSQSAARTRAPLYAGE